jgi:hypothetical protein
MATGASKPNAGVMNYAKRASAAGTPVIDGGMNMSIAGTRNAIGMTMITTATTTESWSFMSGSGMQSRSQPMCYLITCPSTSVPEAEYPGQDIANPPVPGPPTVAFAVKFTVEPSCSVPVPDTFTVFAPVLTDENPAVSDNRILAEVSR